jgi:hypothetical protein
MTSPVPPILDAIARRYERSTSGRTGVAQRDFRVDIETVLSDLQATEGDARAVAEQHLRDAAAIGLIQLEPLHPRDPQSLHRICLPIGGESPLYKRIGRPSPEQTRHQIAEQFHNAANTRISSQWAEAWSRWCHQKSAEAQTGSLTVPFDRSNPEANRELLELLPRLLSWEGESLVRFASCVLCGNSKRLEELASLERIGTQFGQLRGKLGRILAEITSGQIQSLDDLGILPNPRSVLLHGPLQLQFDTATLDLGLFHGPVRVSHQDILRASALTTTASRCLTVENETSFHELAKLQSGELLIHTSFPGAATLSLLQRCPTHLEFWHFGDSDEAGFEILRVLKEKSGHNIQPFQMQPGKIPFEQEALGRPDLPIWPFYSAFMAR